MNKDLENKLKDCDTFFYCPGTLSEVSEEELNQNIFSNVRSKIVELGFYAEDLPQQDPYRAVGMVIEEDNTYVHFFKDNLKTHLLRRTKSNKGDMFVFVDSLSWWVESGSVKNYYYKIIDKPIFGEGNKKYRAEIVFSDKYFIDVFADNEDHAIENAYKVEMNSWTHDWPKDEELTNFQSVRQSLWGKKMISVREHNA
jgi:hypothetical protein